MRPGARVVDLGAAPGGWTQVAVERAKAREGRGHVVAVDLAPMEPVSGAEFLELDFLDRRRLPASAPRSAAPPTWC